MNIFNLPDLGEGLADAEIREWHVKIGDEVKIDQPLVCMETAKAVVEVPSPQAGIIKKLYGEVGSLVKTHAPLVEFEESDLVQIHDKGSVVGSLEESSQHLDESEVIIGSPKKNEQVIKAMPVVRQLAKQLHVDLNTVIASGPQGQITAEDVKKTANMQNTLTAILEPVRGVRRAMAQTMTLSHQEIVPVTLFEDADISDLPTNSDMTVYLIQAMISAIKAEPNLNAWYDKQSQARQLFEDIHLGLAIDTDEGLFVPVIKNIGQLNATLLRSKINEYKQAAKARSFSASDLQGATICLSNFGMIAGKYATPIIVPPMVAILASGKIREIAAVHQGEIKIRRIVPLSLTFDHRAVTGGEATRFLSAVIKFLQGN
jgi:2-oxoisovalerate dehydrogenase E2 component (dihydrolipoyl transacylase)